jgi:error-prone DNA polymerase
VTRYTELHAASAFSFLQGASLPETLVERAAALGYSAIALVDADGVYGAPRFHKAAKQAGLRAIIGAELTIESTPRIRRPDSRTTNPESRTPTPDSRLPTWRLPVLVEGQEGYRNLCRLVTRMKMRAAKGEGALALGELEGYTTGLVALAGRPVLDAQRYGVGGLLDRIVGLFGRRHVCVELQRHLLRDEEADNVALSGLPRAFGVPVIATNDVR